MHLRTLSWSTLVLATVLVLTIQTPSTLASVIREKRFKTSPFSWSNPLSGYNIVLVRIPNTLLHQDKYQLQVIRSNSNPYVNRISPEKMRPRYVLKWLGKYPEESE